MIYFENSIPPIVVYDKNGDVIEMSSDIRYNGVAHLVLDIRFGEVYLTGIGWVKANEVTNIFYFG